MIQVHDPMFPSSESIIVDQEHFPPCGDTFKEMTQFVKDNWKRGVALRKRAHWLFETSHKLHKGSGGVEERERERCDVKVDRRECLRKLQQGESSVLECVQGQLELTNLPTRYSLLQLSLEFDGIRGIGEGPNVVNVSFAYYRTWKEEDVRKEEARKHERERGVPASKSKKRTKNEEILIPEICRESSSTSVSLALCLCLYHRCC